MKKIINSLFFKATLFCSMFVAFHTVLLAQGATVEVNGQDVGSWFGRNWMWIAGVIVLLLIIILAGGSSRRNSRTTVVTDRNGEVRRTTTTTSEVE
ncbi:hypothetical protein [Sediminibacterium ginsengisoli]|uniref:Uncharacterized protein n=1 Tax=Sediminibacterium ginsengisoli TaxID=413434 RepID=A0A1T4LCV4_9BACT|nr:hypothetical protein [Sediminibacterium ginsengisoli]SJZ52344.1 hypothetical protein SAMN04488132_102428 [Sediminibacterium ginsengisoli]